MAAEHTPSLPGFSWNEDSTLRVANSDRKLRRWGSVQQASAMLDDCDRVIIYDLIECGSIRGYKRKPHRANSHWRIDLLPWAEPALKEMLPHDGSSITRFYLRPRLPCFAFRGQTNLQ